MRKVLFVGETPLGTSGNSNMMRALMGQLDLRKYKLAVYGAPSGYNIRLDFYEFPPYTLIPVVDPGDKWGKNQLLNLIQEQQFDALVMVGIDIWTYAPIFEPIMKLQHAKNFIWIAIFPYDAFNVRKDWVRWINMVQFPCVYSQFGEELLKPHVPNIRYFRPNLFGNQLFHKVEPDVKQMFRRKYFPTLGDDFLFGWIGNNQIRKDPQRAIMAYMNLKKTHPNTNLYLHTEMTDGVYNLSQIALDYGARTGDIISKGQAARKWVDPRIMVEIYNSIDCLVNSSLQEGLSWTLVEAMLCGTPLIATDTTAQTELVKDVGILVPCEELCFLPVVAEKGGAWIEARCCNVDDLQKAMQKMVDDVDFREECSRRGVEKGKEWLAGVSNITTLLDECFQEKEKGGGRAAIKRPTKYDKVLFAQHSSAGDVFMTTRCFKGIKERYDGRPLVYMTQKHYTDIVKGNPYLEEVLDWDEYEMEYFQFVLNPHRERIMPGHWGRNCNSILSDFYWKILMVNPCPFHIELVEPPEDVAVILENVDNICVVHTTGGDPEFRTYMYMEYVCRMLEKDYFTVQLGGKDDYPAGAALDLRGKLSFRQTAWVMDKAVVSITVDSFVSHLAGALGISQIALFGSGNAYVVRPNQVKGELICLVPDYVMDCPGLGPCSGSIRNCPTPCTGVHSPETIVESIRELEKANVVRRNYAQDQTSSYRFKYVQ